MNTRELTLDARNRALRAFLVNLSVDVFAAVALALSEAMTAEGVVDWRVLWLFAAKTLVASAGSFILRRYGDPSNVWTPLPPDPQPAPADPIEPGDKF